MTAIANSCVAATGGTSAFPAARLIGDTPFVELTTLSAELPHRIVGKCEFLNPNGSVKDRIGQHILRRAEESGLITPGRSTLVEGTAGNTGIALAAAANRRYRLVCTMSSKMGAEKEAALTARGVEVVRCPYEVPPDDPGSFLNTARRLAEEVPDGYYVNQFENIWNVEAHYLTTGRELVAQTAHALDGDLAAFVAGAGTGGTFTGVARRLVEAGITARRVLADPEGSVLADAVAGRRLAPGPYRVEGIGGDFVPPLLDFSLVTDVVTVPDEESFAMCRRVAADEGLFLGGSSGCALTAAVRYAERIPGPRSTIVVLLPDGGERYLSTVYGSARRADS